MACKEGVSQLMCRHRCWGCQLPKDAIAVLAPGRQMLCTQIELCAGVVGGAHSAWGSQGGCWLPSLWSRANGRLLQQSTCMLDMMLATCAGGLLGIDVCAQMLPQPQAVQCVCVCATDWHELSMLARATAIA
jgi:hypothetical protein